MLDLNAPILQLNAQILPSIHGWASTSVTVGSACSLSKSIRKITRFSPSLSSYLCSELLILLRGEMRLLCLCKDSVFSACDNHTWNTVINRPLRCCTLCNPALTTAQTQNSVVTNISVSPLGVLRERRWWKGSGRRSNTEGGLNHNAN